MLSGALHLKRVHLINGGLVASGGCVRMSSGSKFIAEDSSIANCVVRAAATTAVSDLSTMNHRLDSLIRSCVPCFAERCRDCGS